MDTDAGQSCVVERQAWVHKWGCWCEFVVYWETTRKQNAISCSATYTVRAYTFWRPGTRDHELPKRRIHSSRRGLLLIL